MSNDLSSNQGLPRYRDLPELPGGGRSGWGLFGDDDSVGLMNLLTPHGVVDAARLIRKGAVFPLDLAIGFIDPPFFQRGATRHRVLERRPGFGLDDVLDNYFPQSGSQWDSLGHVPYERNSFYNGASSEEVKSGRRNTIDNWARRGIVTRGILLDVADDVAAAGGAGDSTPVTVEFLERARQRAGVDYRPGDVLLGGITPIGLPTEWPIFIDRRVAETDIVVLGSGIRASKILVPGWVLAGLPGARIIDGLARLVATDDDATDDDEQEQRAS